MIPITCSICFDVFVAEAGPHNKRCPKCKGFKPCDTPTHYAPYPAETRESAKGMWRLGYDKVSITQATGVHKDTLASWIREWRA